MLNPLHEPTLPKGLRARMLEAGELISQLDLVFLPYAVAWKRTVNFGLVVPNDGAYFCRPLEPYKIDINKYYVAPVYDTPEHIRRADNLTKNIHQKEIVFVGYENIERVIVEKKEEILDGVLKDAYNH